MQVTISLRRRIDGPPAPDFDAVAAVPLNSRKPLSQDEFAAKYGAHPVDIAKVEDFVSTAGMRVVESNAARRTVVAAGTVAPAPAPEIAPTPAPVIVVAPAAEIVAAPPPKPTPVYRKWWLWTAVGAVVVVGLGVGLGVGLTRDGHTTPTFSGVAF